MKAIKLILLFFISVSAANLLFGEDEKDVSMRFYAGDILRAEVQQDNGTLQINNVSEYEPPSRITSDVGYAAITVRPDSGRSLGMYDYSLVNGGKIYPCVALMNTDGDFDGSLWEIKKTKASRKYTMLFKVQLPPMGKPKYALRFNLLKGKWKDIPVPFVYVKDKPFTNLKDIPANGMLGVDPYKPKPQAVPAAPPAAGDQGKAGEAKPDAAKKEEPKKPVDKDAAKKAKGKEWEAMLGDIKFDKSEEKKKDNKKKDDKKPKKDDKKKAADAWDDWK